MASTLSGARATSASTAAPTPRSERNAGWMPRANSRSSASATASFSPISSTVLARPESPRRALSIRRSSASATSCCCAPSCRLRSIRRRASSAASTIRSRETRSSSTRARSSAFRRSLSIASAAALAAAVTSSGVASSSASWTIAASRTPPRSTAVQVRPEPGVGQLDLAARVVDEDLPLRQPVGDRQRAVAEPLGQQLAHRPALDRRACAAPARERAQRRPMPSSAAIETIVGRQREHAQRDPDRRAERPRPDELPVARPRARSTPRPGQHDRQQHRRDRQRRARAARRAARAAASPPRARTPGCRARSRSAAAARRGRGTGGRCVVQQPVGLAALALREPPRQPHVPRRIGRPIHSGASSTPSTSPPPTHQVRQALAEPDEQVQQRAPGVAQVR